MKIITRDGERVAVVADRDAAFAWLQRYAIVAEAPRKPVTSWSRVTDALAHGGYAITDTLPNVHGSGKRAAVERALELWVTRKVLFDAYADGDRYTVTSGNGTLWERLTLKEASLLVHGCASAWHADRSGS